MLIKVTDRGDLLLEGAEDFGRFSISIDPGAGALAGAALDRIARLDGTDYAWVSQEGLRTISPFAGVAEWESGLARMAAYAASKGWLDPEGAIRAHIVNAQAMVRESDDTLAAVDADHFKQAMRNLAGGVAIVATGSAGNRTGLTVTAVTSVSTEPPCLLVCVNKSSLSHDAILANGRFSVNLLGTQHEALAMRFAGMCGLSGAARFEGSNWESGRTGSPFLTEAICAMDCEILMHQAVGSHGIFIGRVVGTKHGEGAPLVNFRGRMMALGGN